MFDGFICWVTQWSDVIRVFLAFIAALVTGVGVSIAATSLFFTRYTAAVRFADDYVSEVTAPEIYALRRRLAHGDLEDGDYGKFLDLMNKTEKMSLAYRRNALDRAFFCDFYRSTFIVDWIYSRKFIAQLRSEIGRESVFEHFEWLVLKIAKKDELLDDPERTYEIDMAAIRTLRR